jgi:hypothetical protein
MATMLALLATLTAPAAFADRSCAWPVQATANQANIAYPDEAAKYWLSVLPIPQGGYIEVASQYPHARYTSFVTYTAQTQAIDSVNDQQIMPDTGSSDPMSPNADRTASERKYTVKIVAGQAPESGREPNTLYTSNEDGSKTSGNLAVFILRIYAPDLGTGITGAVPLPTLSLVTSEGEKTTLPDCPLDGVPDTGLNQIIAASGSPLPLPEIGAFGNNPVVWHKFSNLPTVVTDILTDNSLTGSTVEPAVTGITNTQLPGGGFLENIDNKYIYGFMDRSFGQVLVLHGKAPTTPHTLAGDPRMGTGELRYWSMCTENAETTAFFGCTYDELAPLDRDGYYTIVISPAAARPANAKTECGAVWLPSGPAIQTTLLMRHMLPAPSFLFAIQNVAVGQEQQGMGEYYPVGRYYADAQSFEQTGCASPAIAGRAETIGASGGGGSFDLLLLAGMMLFANRRRSREVNINRP